MSINIDWYVNASEEEIDHERQMRAALRSMDDAPGPADDDFGWLKDIQAELLASENGSDEIPLDDEFSWLKEIKAEPLAPESSPNEIAVDDGASLLKELQAELLASEDGTNDLASGPSVVDATADRQGTTDTNYVATQEAPVTGDAEPHRYRRPKEASRAWRAIQHTLDLARNTSSRSVVIHWGASEVGNSSTFSLNNKSEEKHKSFKEKGKNWTKFPLSVPDRFGATESQGRLRLPLWKNIGNAGRDSIPAEVTFGLRVASLANHGAPMDRAIWQETDSDPSLGYLSVEMSGEAAERFLAGEKGDAGGGLRRGLLRALERAVGGPASVVAAWVGGAGDGAPVTLFLAMRLDDKACSDQAVVVDAAERYRLAQPDPDNVDWYEYSGVGSSCEIEEDLCRARAARVWQRTIRYFGVPTWFRSDVIETIRDYLLRDPNDLLIRQYVIARKKKCMATKADKLALTMVECRELVIEGAIRFYVGSPAQFAAVVFASGNVLGTYVDRLHQAAETKAAYEQLRAGVFS